MAYDPDRKWTADDVPAGPYFHGSRKLYKVGEYLLTDIVSERQDQEDRRQMCFATTSEEEALGQAYQRGVRHGGETLYVFEIALLDPEVDVNMHPPGLDHEVTCVMSPRGEVIRIAREVALEDYPDRWLRAFEDGVSDDDRTAD
jgi:hypothetical protein